MEDFDKDELIQLVNFYKNRAADLEFQLLHSQLKINKLSTAEPVAATKTTKDKA